MQLTDMTTSQLRKRLNRHLRRRGTIDVENPRLVRLVDALMDRKAFVALAVTLGTAIASPMA